MSASSKQAAIPPTTLRNQVVLASAGSGKTFQLSLRIIRLLLENQPPESIVALTFTRAAAAEFAARVLQMLAKGAADDAGAAELSENLGVSRRSKEEFAGLLQRTLLNLNRLTLGTLDGFFARMVNNFPTEVGLSTPSPRTLEELEGESIRQETLAQLFASCRPAEARTLAEQVRIVAGERNIATPIRGLDRQVGRLHDLYTLANDSSIWGNQGRIWGKDMPKALGRPSKAELAAAKSEWMDWAENGAIPVKPQLTEGRIATFREKAKARAQLLLNISDKYLPKSKDVEAALGKMETVLRAEPQEAASTFFHAPIAVPASACAAFQILASNLLGRLLEAKLAETRNLEAFLARYEAIYGRKVRTRGKLTFSDYVTLLLRAPGKLDIDYRLDGEIRHWLFDEFQDTSTRQYKVLSNLINEVITDSQVKPGERTVFFVGDLKQALYGWRAGNPRLLEGIRKELAAIDPKSVGKLPYTRRCSQPVVDLVNALLGKAACHGTGYSPKAAKRWGEIFENHATKLEESKRPALGEARWVRLEKLKNEPAGGDVVRQAQWIAADLKQAYLIEPDTHLLRRGVTCAILVSSNEDAAVIAETLRKNGIQAADESMTEVAQDNPLTAGLVALAQLTAHPGDQLATGLAEMSPAARAVVARLGGIEKTRVRLAEVFHEAGAEALVLELTQGLVIGRQDNASRFVSKRIKQLHALATKYDESGVRDLDGFCRYVSSTGVRDRADSRAVEVLTVHRSKGLQYTCVYLPCLNSTNPKMASPRREMPMVHENPMFYPDWIMSRPNSSLVEADTVLSLHSEKEKADAAYESLCKLYVGVTRAVRSVVLISLPTAGVDAKPEDRAGTYDLAELVENCLGTGAGAKPSAEASKPAETTEKAKTATATGELWKAGNSDWIDMCHPRSVLPKKESEEATDEKKVEPETKPTYIPVVRPPRTKPSSAKKEGDTGRHWVAAEIKHAGRAFGSLVHGIFEGLEWDVDGFEAKVRRTKESTKNAELAAACELVLQCVSSASVREHLKYKPNGCLLWRERQAALLHEDRLMPAVFDRVHVVPGKEATILDYKTNSGMTDDALREEYCEQMNSYRIAVSKLADVPQDKVRCVLIHVRKGTVVDV